jgi:signal transduction histidine kinase
MSFRDRILLTSLVTLAIGLGALVIAGNVLLDVRVNAEQSTRLRADADAQRAALRVVGGRVQVNATPADVELDRSWVLDGDRVVVAPANASAALDALAVRLGREQRAGEHDGPNDTRLRVAPITAAAGGRPVGAIVVALPTEPLERLQKAVLLGSVVMAALVLLAGGLALRTAIDRALEPVARMTATAEDWGAHDLDRRFDLGPPRDELTGLAATLDGLLARIAASRRHERRFAAEIAHELRTPLAGIRGRAELAVTGDGPAADAERRAALAAIVDQAERLTGTIDTLLAVARRELDPTDGTVDMVALAREVEGVGVAAPDDAVLRAEGEPDVLRRALAPLVDNARRHAAGAVRLELARVGDRVRVAVRDDGPGVDPALGDRVFVPGVSGTDGGGAGLGLPLARRLARSCGGDVTLGDGPGGCFVLELPAAPAAPDEAGAARRER